METTEYYKLEEDEALIVPYGHYKISNLVITAKRNSTLLENQILFMGIKNVEVKGYDLISEIPGSTIKKILGKNYNAFNEQLKKASVGLQGSYFFIEDKENPNDFMVLSLIKSAKYKNGVFTIKFNDELKDNLIDVKKDFTLLEDDAINKAKSNYSLKLYSILKQRCYVPNHLKGKVSEEKFRIPFELAELKIYMGAVDLGIEEIKKIVEFKKDSEGYEEVLKKIENLAERQKDPVMKKRIMPKYQRWSDFKSQVLDVAIEEINSRGELFIELEYPFNCGKSIKNIEFIVTLCKKKKDSDNEKELSSEDILELIEKLNDEYKDKFTLKEYKTLLKEAKYNIELVKKQISNLDNANYNDKMAWMIAAIRKDYSDKKEPGKAEKKGAVNSFTNYNQNTYDYGLIEWENEIRQMNGLFDFNIKKAKELIDGSKDEKEREERIDVCSSTLLYYLDNVYNGEGAKDEASDEQVIVLYDIIVNIAKREMSDIPAEFGARYFKALGAISSKNQ